MAMGYFFLFFQKKNVASKRFSLNCKLCLTFYCSKNAFAGELTLVNWIAFASFLHAILPQFAHWIGNLIEYLAMSVQLWCFKFGGQKLVSHLRKVICSHRIFFANFANAGMTEIWHNQHRLTYINSGPKCMARVACLWSKMPMFQRAGMKKEGLPLPLAFQYLILMMWKIFGLNLVMPS